MSDRALQPDSLFFGKGHDAGIRRWKPGYQACGHFLCFNPQRAPLASRWLQAGGESFPSFSVSSTPDACAWKIRDATLALLNALLFLKARDGDAGFPPLRCRRSELRHPGASGYRPSGCLMPRTQGSLAGRASTYRGGFPAANETKKARPLKRVFGPAIGRKGWPVCTVRRRGIG